SAWAPSETCCSSAASPITSTGSIPSLSSAATCWCGGTRRARAPTFTRMRAATSWRAAIPCTPSAPGRLPLRVEPNDRAAADARADDALLRLDLFEEEAAPLDLAMIPAAIADALATALRDRRETAAGRLRFPQHRAAGRARRAHP